MKLPQLSGDLFTGGGANHCGVRSAECGVRSGRQGKMGNAELILVPKLDLGTSLGTKLSFEATEPFPSATWERGTRGGNGECGMGRTENGERGTAEKLRDVGSGMEGRALSRSHYS